MLLLSILLAAVAAIAYFFATATEHEDSVTGLLNPQSVRGSGRTMVPIEIENPREGLRVTPQKIATSAAIGVAVGALIFAAGDLITGHSLTQTVSTMIASVPHSLTQTVSTMIASVPPAADYHSAVYEIETVEESEDGSSEVITEAREGYRVHLVFRKEGRRIEVASLTDTSFTPIPTDDSLSVKVGKDGDWVEVSAPDLRRSIAHLAEGHFDAVGTDYDLGEVTEVFERIRQDAIHAANYAQRVFDGKKREKKRTVYRPHNVPDSDEAAIVDTFEYVSPDENGDPEMKELALVEEEVRAPRRPFLDLLGVERVKLGDDAQEEKKFVLASVSNWLSEKESKVIVGDRDDAVFAAKDPAGVMSTLGLFNGEGKYNLEDNVHVLRRAGVILGRTGNFHFPVEMPNNVLPEDTDGTILVTSEVDEPWQGTLYARANGRLYSAKGVVRPPAEGEEEGVGEGALGCDLSEIDEAKVFTISRFEESSSRLNLQAVAFSAEDGGTQVFNNWAKRVRNWTIEDILGGEELGFYRAGLPAKFLRGVQDIRSYAHKMEIKAGYRNKVVGVGLGEDGNPILDGDRKIRLPKKGVMRMQSHLGRELEEGETLFVLRDPCLPDGSGIQKFEYAGISETGAVEISAFSDVWVEMGGDFDGDAAVVWHPDATPGLKGNLVDHTVIEINGVDEETEEIIAETGVRDDGFEEPIRDEDDNISMQSAVMQKAGSWSQKIGITASHAQRAWAIDEDLFSKTRGANALLTQGCIDDKKHSVLDRVLGVLEDVAESVWDYIDDEDMDIIGLVSAHKNAGDETKGDAWEDLVGAAEDMLRRLIEDGEVKASAAAIEYLDHVRAVDEKFQEFEELNEDRPDRLPDDIQQSARRTLISRHDAAEWAFYEDKAETVGKKWGFFMHKSMEADAAGNNTAAGLWADRADRVTESVAQTIRDGRMPAEAIIAADVSSSFVLEVIRPEDLDDVLSDEESTETEENETPSIVA